MNPRILIGVSLNDTSITKVLISETPKTTLPVCTEEGKGQRTSNENKITIFSNFKFLLQYTLMNAF